MRILTRLNLFVVKNILGFKIYDAHYNLIYDCILESKTTSSCPVKAVKNTATSELYLLSDYSKYVCFYKDIERE